ncbi:hypothetical protein V1525DRAFT_356176 [Lipomyces kononenkoae]|uniref:Uncharacterized protein n=1 Tax=Lipomyces kononenkoae TaxID=34357 RepID=A0ACC3T7H4_LIPKO
MASMGGPYGQAPPPKRLTLTSEERTIYGQLFKSLDTESLGIVTGESARTLFERSGLSPLVLGRIWQIADDQNNGFLTQTGFAIALRLIGYVQSGQRLAPELASQPGPLPRFEQPVPPLIPADRARFVQLFESSASDGVLSGERAREIFVRAKLPTETLGQIWNLADAHRRGALDATEFVIAMHLIQCTLNGSLPALPSAIPPALLAAAATTSTGLDGVRPSSRTGARPSVAAPQIPPPQPQHQQPPPPRQRGHQYPAGPQSPTAGQIPRQLTGASSVSSQQSFGAPARTGSIPVHEDWLITPAQKEHYDGIFATIDRENRGFIGGDVAVPFFMTSKLSDDVLAQIWDMSDIRNTGELSKDEFAVAMYLVQQKLTGNELPQTLPPLLVPPALRTRSPAAAPNPVFLPGTAPASVFDISPQQPPPAQPAQPAQSAHVKSESALLDLFDLDDSAFASPTSTAPGAATASLPKSQPSAPTARPVPVAPPSSASPSAPSTATFGAVPTQISPNLTGRAPFVPSSAFGQSIQQQLTSQPSAPPATVSANAPATVPAGMAPPVQPSPVLSKSSAATSPVVASQPFSVPPPPPTSFPRAAAQSITTPPVSSSTSSSVVGNEDLLLADDEIKTKMAAEKTQFGKLSTEIGSLTSQTQALKEKRAKAEAELAKMVALRQDIEGKLQQLHGVYESEAAKVRAVEQQLATSTNETAKLRQEYALLESSVHSVQVQYQEVMSNLETDQTENATLKEKIRLVQEQTAQVQEALEKAKREARQQKGLVAINKKSLTSAEGELAKSQKELEETQEDAEIARTTSMPTNPEDVAPTNDFNPFLQISGPTELSSTASVPGVMLAAAVAASEPESEMPSVTVSPVSSVPASIFENMFADFQRPASDISQQVIASPVVGAPSVEESEASSLPRTGYEDDDDDQIASSPATTTTAATTHLFNATTGGFSGAGAAAALVNNLQAAEIESVSSSVVNNAPESVREGFSRPESPTLHSHTSSVSAVTASEGSDQLAKDRAGESTGETPEPSGLPGPETVTVNELASEPAPTAPEPPAEPSAPPADQEEDEAIPDPFALKPKQKQFAGTKEDFDAVFSELGLLPKKRSSLDETRSDSSSGRPFATQFPPIEDLQIDEESSSEEEREREPEIPVEPTPVPHAAANTAPSEPVVQAVASAPESVDVHVVASEPEAPAFAPPADIFASFEDSFATAPIASPASASIATSPFTQSYPVAPVASKDMQDSFDAVFASFNLPPSAPAAPASTSEPSSQSTAPSAPAFTTFDESFPPFPASSAPLEQPAAFTQVSSHGPPLPPKIPISGTDSTPHGPNGFDEFDNAFSGLEDAKNVTSSNGRAGTTAILNQSFDKAFEDFGTEFGSSR